MLKQGAGSSFRIVGGYHVPLGQLPWQVLIRLSKASVGSRHPPSFCGGAIIDKKWILTAAHCFDAWVGGCGCSADLRAKSQRMTRSYIHREDSFLMAKVLLVCYTKCFLMIWARCIQSFKKYRQTPPWPNPSNATEISATTGGRVRGFCL